MIHPISHSGERLLSTVEPGDLGIPVLKHLHHVWPHYVKDDTSTTTAAASSGGGDSDGGGSGDAIIESTLYPLVQGWSAGKLAVLKHEPNGTPSLVKGWDLSPGGEGQL